MSLQIPDSASVPLPAPGTTKRPVSSAVASSGSASASPSHRHRQQRASHQVASSPNESGPTNGHSASSPSTTDVYSHPAAVAYAAAHPRRTIPKFGPYLLLQTLGEGEFGKVKLGLHTSWGEEVAVKLIRRGNIDSQVRMSKVEREIEVLRSLKHPNIVRLYDVIETDKYIGIILEYASGGELFDHILAHRYLKEKDATRLFSQLISGVYYIHKKKIVHRDLKLENLLLDRHRNVIITDFGFANRFEHKADDLMQTSCGSPCYAAPELVISEGLYVGSAVDIWSCGVILYAMLAGYLPFDDDPQNPDGDNINLLYKYIVNTPLSFPDYISPSARSILQLMLVPDPKRRASLEEVMRHPWLHEFNNGGEMPMGSAFGKSVQDLERIAMEQHQVKRMAYQRQMKQASAARQQREQPQPPTQPRSASHQPIYATNGTNGHAPMDVDDPFAGPKGAQKPTPPVEEPAAAPPPAPAAESPRKERKHRKEEGRHTIQVEYTPASPNGARDSKGKRKASTPPEDIPMDTDNQHAPTKTHRSSGSSSTKPLPVPPASSVSAPPPSSYVPVPVPKQENEDVHMADPAQDLVIPVPATPIVSSPPQTPITFAQNASATSPAPPTPPESGSRKGNHRRVGSIGNKIGGFISRVPTLNGGNTAKDKESSHSREETTLNPGTVTPTSSVSQEEREKEGKKSRRNTLGLVVGTIRRGAGRMSGSVAQVSTRTSSKGTESESVTTESGMPPPPPTAPPLSTASSSIVPPAPSTEELGVGGTPGVSTNKAKKVMQWFRQGRSSMGMGASSETLPADEKRMRKKSTTLGPSTPSLLDTSISADPTISPITPTPTQEGRSKRSGERTPSFVSRFTRGSMGVVSGGSRATGGSSSGNGKEKAIRVHHGAVDQTMITSRPPVDVMKSVREVLEGMGVEVAVEGEYKFRAVRVKRPKGSTSSTPGIEVAAFVASGTAGSSGVDSRGLPVPQQRESGLLRGLLTMRRQSSQVGNTSTMSVESANEDGSGTEGLPTSSVGGPIYGPSQADMADEVRFSVELTRLDRLKDTYSLDVRRLKGNLRSYKFLYEVLRERTNLGE